MNYLDMLIAVPILWGLYKGFTKGLVLQLAGIIGFVGGIYVAIHFSGYTAGKLRDWFNWQSKYLPVIAFAFTFLAVLIGVFALGKLITRSLEDTPLGWANKLSGAAIGILKYALLMSVFFYIIDSVERKIPLLDRTTKEKSLLYVPVSRIAPFVFPALKEIIRKV